MALNYCVKGTGEVVVLLHGLFGTLKNLSALANELSKHYQVISVDLINHGESPHQGEIYLSDMVSAVYHLLAQNNQHSVHLVGHSLGGKIAMQLALEHPSLVTSLVVIDIAPVSYPNVHQDVFDALDKLVLEDVESREDAERTLRNLGLDFKTCSFLASSLVNHNGSYQWEFDFHGLKASYQNLMNWECHSQQYTGPCKFLKGELSKYITENNTQAILQYFPNSRLETFKNAGHWLHVEKISDVNQSVLAFLNN